MTYYEKLIDTRNYIKFLIKPMLIITIAILLAIPVSFSILLNINAASGVDIKVSDANTHSDNYTFVILDDESVPLAASYNTSDTPSATTLLFTFSFILVVIMVFGYLFWFYINKSSIIRLSAMLTEPKKTELLSSISILHPIKLKMLKSEAETDVANIYLLNTY